MLKVLIRALPFAVAASLSRSPRVRGEALMRTARDDHLAAADLDDLPARCAFDDRLASDPKRLTPRGSRPTTISTRNPEPGGC